MKKRIWRLCDVVTGDESWFYHKQIGRKSSNAAWVAKGDPPPTVVRFNKFASETLSSIFLSQMVPLLFIVLNVDKLLTVGTTLTIVDKLSSMKLSVKDYHSAHAVLNYLITMENLIFTKLFAITLNQRISQ